MVQIYRPTISPNVLIQRLQTEIQQQNNHSSAASLASQVACQQSQLEHIHIILNGAAMIAQPRATLPKTLAHLPIFGISKVQRLLLKVYNFLFKEQRTVNLVTIQAVREATTLLQQVSGQTNNLVSSLQELVASIDDRINSIDDRINSIDDRINSIDDRINSIDDRINSNIQVIDRTIQFIERNHGDRLRYLQSDMAQQKRLITLSLEQHNGNINIDSLEKNNQPLTDDGQSIRELQLDVFYRALEDKFRGDRSQIRERLQVYLPFLQQNKLRNSEDLILDIGCGRGEWIELLRDEGYQCLGLDVSQAMLDQCQELGLSALKGDALTYLQSLPDETLGCITGFHIVEHLPFEVLIQLMSEVYRVVRKGGVIIFETPNPRNVIVGSCNFYLDPTHKNPIPPEMLQFMAQYSGFSMAEIITLNSSESSRVLENSDLANRFNELFYGSMDYAVIGVKE